MAEFLSRLNEAYLTPRTPRSAIDDHNSQVANEHDMDIAKEHDMHFADENNILELLSLNNFLPGLRLNKRRSRVSETRENTHADTSANTHANTHMQKTETNDEPHLDLVRNTDSGIWLESEI